MNEGKLGSRSVLFGKIAVLQIANNLLTIHESKASKFIREGLFAVLNPIEDLFNGILSFGQNCLSINGQGRI